MGGDFNSHPGTEFGNEIVNWCDETGLCIADFELLPSDTYTFVDYAHGSPRWLDHFIVTPSMIDLQMKVEMHNKFASSDHLPMYFSFMMGDMGSNDNNGNNVIENNGIENGLLGRPKDCQEYRNNSEYFLSLIEIPVESLLACGVNVPLSDFHRMKISKFHNDIVNALCSCTAQPLMGNRQHAYNPIAGWNDYVRDDHAHARHCYSLWRDFGRPHHGALFDLMKSSRAQFKRSLHQCRRNKEMITADRLAQSMDR